MGIHLFHCVHGGEKMASHDVVWILFVTIIRNVGFHVSQKQTHVLPPPLTVFTLTNWHCVDSWWCLHVSRRCHCQPHLSWFGVMDCSFWWGCANNHESCEGFFFIVIDFWQTCFWMSTPASGRVFSLMCQHGVGSERHRMPSSFNFTRIL